MLQQIEKSIKIANQLFPQVYNSQKPFFLLQRFGNQQRLQTKLNSLDKVFPYAKMLNIKGLTIP